MGSVALECEEKEELAEDGQEDLEDLEGSQEDPGKLEREQNEEVEAAGKLRPQHQRQSGDNPH